MHRRQFTGTLAGAFAAVLSGAPLRTLGRSRTTTPAIDAARLNRRLKELSAFGANPQGGVSRVAYSDADRAGRDYVTNLMRSAGLDPRVDVAGNIWGRRPGTDASLKPVVFGSHIDSVPEGGNYDGTVGSLSAIEVAQALGEQGTRTRHPLEIVVWANEEGGLYGSRAVSGQLTAAELSNRAWSGKTIEEGMAFIGGTPARIS
jgi:N-carbamoyl-L-amino-acid hydrolase